MCLNPTSRVRAIVIIYVLCHGFFNSQVYFSTYPIKHDTSFQCWTNVGTQSTTLAQHWIDVSYLLESGLRRRDTSPLVFQSMLLELSTTVYGILRNWWTKGRLLPRRAGMPFVCDDHEFTVVSQMRPQSAQQCYWPLKSS